MRRSKTRLYTIWVDMKQRCTNENRVDYHLYGGRGISVCPEWADSSLAFEAWAKANGYREDLTLERKDNNGPYAPWNCAWATVKEQANNRSTNRYLTYEGRTQTISQWADELGIPRKTLQVRIWRGWSVERALTEPLRIWGAAA